MDYFVVCLTALLASGLTLFSGFGLGTLLLPAFALFFPVHVAVAATAVVHLANNLFKVGLVGRQADWSVVLRFALPGAAAALVGAALLATVADISELTTYDIGSSTYEVTVVGIIIGIVIISLAVLEIVPWYQRLSFDRKQLPLGGILSGFFGGLSGNQGAFRAAFLVRVGLSKEAFIGTSIMVAVIVDLARLSVYGLTFRFSDIPSGKGGLVIAATLAAFTGAFVGSRLVQKVTLRTIQLVIAGLLIVVGVGMAVGLF